jgi:Ca2+-binding RTX toxin-like protein
LEIPVASVVDAPTTTNAIIGSLLSDKVWGETTLQYLFGGADALTLDTEFEANFHDNFKGTPDATFAFAGQMEQTYDALSSVSGLTFEATTDTSAADFVLVSSARDIDGVTEGFHNFPGTSFRDDDTQLDSWQIGAFNSGMANLLAVGEKGGGAYGNWTIMHEVGHGVGLLHPHDGNGDTLPELVGLDNERYTVMSYNGASQGTKFGHAVTYMALDIASLQTLYGVSNYATGDSTYRLTDKGTAALSLEEGNMSIGRAFASIWDTGGSDTIVYAGRSNTVLNLSAATLDKSVDLGLDELRDYVSGNALGMFSEAGSAGGVFSFIRGQAGGYSIANGAEIENATTGAGDDVLAGNALDNVLRGGRGDDVLFGNGGTDVLTGGRGADVFIYSVGATIADFNEAQGDVLVGDWPVG